MGFWSIHFESVESQYISWKTICTVPTSLIFIEFHGYQSVYIDATWRPLS